MCALFAPRKQTTSPSFNTCSPSGVRSVGPLCAVPALAETIHGVDVGSTVLLAGRTQTSSCTLGANPDRQCSPGAYYSKLTKSRICAADFRTDPIRDVSQSEKNDVKVEYGLQPVSFGSALEIDHIVSLELGGSNDIANLFPEKANADPAGYHVKDKAREQAARPRL
jgi:hypothetical protein